MPYSTPYPICIFCDHKANSREHAIPKWMSKQLGIKALMPVTAGNATPRKQPISFASHRKHIFCKGCNKHFKQVTCQAPPLDRGDGARRPRFARRRVQRARRTARTRTLQATRREARLSG